jgi:hypothetical protein
MAQYASARLERSSARALFARDLGAEAMAVVARKEADGGVAG